MSEQTKFGYGENSEQDPLVRSRRPKSILKNKTLWIVIVVALIVAVVVAILIVGIAAGVANSQTEKIYDSVRIEQLVSHLKGLEEIASRPHNFNSRAVMYGYNESADMVYDKLEDAGYKNITKQMFTVATYVDNGGHLLSATVPLSGSENYTFTFNYLSQFNVMRYSGSTAGEITGSLNVVTANGCSPDNFTNGTVALIDYAPDSTVVGCTLFDMASNAKAAGVTALLMTRTENDTNMNSPPNARIFKQTAEDFMVVDLPMFGVNYQAGKILKDFDSPPGGVTVSLSVDMTVEFWTTYNVLAYTEGGHDDSIIVIGSHLDSVPAGPGINDNGSGSMANLEIALQLINSGTNPENKVLFAFWGAEEWGLLGANHFVKSLDPLEREDIVLNLNFDMIGSPNYIRQVYNGSGAENKEIVEASTIIQELFENRFRSLDLPHKLTGFNGRSDYGPFIEEGVNIPAGGLATGADERKTAEDREIFGGLAGAILDPCYHQSCDTTDNINREVYEQMAQAAAFVLDTLMMKEDLREFLNPSDQFD